MKRTILFFAAFLMVLSTANAQWWSSEKVKGNGEMITKERKVGSYDAVKLIGSMNVELVAGTEGNLKVEAESNLQEYILTEVKNGTLKISVEKDINLDPTEEIKVTVPFKDLEEISLTGSGDIWNSDLIKESNLEVQVTGSGDMMLDLEVEDLEGKITGSGDIELKGKARRFECSVTGSGDFDAFGLSAEEVEAKVAGSGDIMVNASKALKASVAGSGDIIYTGNPDKQDFKTFGSGSVSSK